jgi:hypothetical protein
MVNLGRKVSDAPNCPRQAHLKLQVGEFAVSLMRRHTSKNRKTEVACLLKSGRKKCSYHPSLVYINRGASQVA